MGDVEVPDVVIMVTEVNPSGPGQPPCLLEMNEVRHMPLLPPQLLPMLYTARSLRADELIGPNIVEKFRSQRQVTDWTELLCWTQWRSPLPLGVLFSHSLR